MKATLLFDLDDTLLENSMDLFLPPYLGSLSEHLKSYKPQVDVKKAVLEGTNLMIHNTDPSCTLEEIFDSHFYPSIGIKKDELLPAIDFFYQSVYPKFAKNTKPVFEAQTFIGKLAEKSVNLVIATNPLFPMQATLQRLGWADLGVTPQRFSLITSFEKFHFAKPNPAYYAEILAYLGWPEAPIGMIGNDWEMDIVPPETIGIPTFFLGSAKYHNFVRHSESRQGGWEELNHWINELFSAKSTFELKVSKASIIAILSSTAAYIDSLRRQYGSINFWKKRPEPTEWSLVEIISHITDVDAEVNLPRLKLLREQTNPFFAAIETDQWADERHYIENNVYSQMEMFIANRKLLIDQFSSLSKHDFEKTIQHAIFGPTSVLEIFKFISQHDRIHINQIFKVLTALNQSNNGGLLS